MAFAFVAIKINKCSDRSYEGVSCLSFKETMIDQPTDRPTNRRTRGFIGK